MRSALTTPGSSIDRSTCVAIPIDDDELAARVGRDEQAISTRRRRHGAHSAVETKRRGHLKRSATKRDERRVDAEVHTIADLRVKNARRVRNRCAVDHIGVRRPNANDAEVAAVVRQHEQRAVLLRQNETRASRRRERPVARRREPRDAAVRGDPVDRPSIARRDATSALLASRRRWFRSEDRCARERRCDRHTRAIRRRRRTRERAPGAAASVADVQMTESSCG